MGTTGDHHEVATVHENLRAILSAVEALVAEVTLAAVVEHRLCHLVNGVGANDYRIRAMVVEEVGTEVVEVDVAEAGDVVETTYVRFCRTTSGFAKLRDGMQTYFEHKL